MNYVTCHIQKDGRITLGTRVHKYLDCPSLKNRMNPIEISGAILELLPKCNLCEERDDRNNYRL